MKVSYHALDDLNGSFDWIEQRSSLVYRDLLTRKDIVHSWVSFDAVLFDAAQDAVWCGLNTLDPIRHPILRRFDLSSKKFVKIDLGGHLSRYDVKIHKGMHRRGDDLFFGTAGLHDPVDQFDAPGGKLIRLNVKSLAPELLAIPVGPAQGFPLPGNYIQTTLLDRAGRYIYGCTFPIELFFRFELETRRTEILGSLHGSRQISGPHNLCEDDRGRIWGTCGVANAWSYDENLHPVRPFYYDPDRGSMEFLYDVCLLRERPSDNPSNDAIAFHDQYVYFADKAGNISRVHADERSVQHLGKPMGSGRVAALVKGPGGDLYGSCGDGDGVGLFRILSRTARIEFLGEIVASDGTRPERIHDISFAQDGRIVYAGENDNHHRSSYLWEIDLEPEDRK